jgi:hypothetical protein
MRPVLDILEQYGFLILLMLMYFGFLDVIIEPVIGLVIDLLRAGVR